MIDRRLAMIQVIMGKCCVGVRCAQMTVKLK